MPPFERRHRRPDGTLVCPSCREPGAGGRPGGGNVFGSRPRAKVVADITPERRSPYTPMRENPFEEQTEQGDVTDEGPMAAPPPSPQMVPAPMPTMAPVTTRPRGGNADAGPEIGNDVDFMDEQQGFDMTRAETPEQGVMGRRVMASAGEWKVFELTNWPYGGQRLFLAAQEGPEGKNTPLGGILFNDSEIVSVLVLDYARGHGVARFLFDAVDREVGRQLPDDGYRTRAGAGLLNHLGRPKGKFVKWVSEGDVQRPFKGVFLNFMFGIPEPKDDPNIKRVATMTTSMRKGAPFAGYDDFESCVKANSDKDDPEAYCGKIKHETEGSRRVASQIRLSARDAAQFAIEMQSLRRHAHDSGDGETLYHCPFCGGGNIIGRADGTVWCEFCQRAFTVQVQPEHSSMPQTVNGQPYEMPGMPGDPPERTQQNAPAPESPGVSPEEDLESLGHLLTSDGQWVPASRYVAALTSDLLSEQGQ